MRNHGMSARRRRRLGTRQEGDSLGHGTRRSSFLAPPAQSFCRVARPQIGKGPVEAAGAADAKNAPTAPWETGRPVFHSYHRLCLPALVTGRVSPMFPVNFVTDVPGCTSPGTGSVRRLPCIGQNSTHMTSQNSGYSSNMVATSGSVRTISLTWNRGTFSSIEGSSEKGRSGIRVWNQIHSTWSTSGPGTDTSPYSGKCCRIRHFRSIPSMTGPNVVKPQS
jgi:hypothetical protein